MAKIIIVGAGLTGISTAYHLEKNGFFDYKIFEKEAEFGGLCRTVHQDGFTFDYTGHFLHTSDEYFENLIKSLIGLENFNTINRRSFIFSEDVFTHYPYQVNLFGLPAKTIAACIQGYVSRPQIKKNPKTFYDWVITNFGTGMAEKFFIPFQSKILSYDIKKISASWMGRFVPNTSLEKMIEGALQEPKMDQSIGYSSKLIYPKQGGIFYWVEKLAKQLLNPIQTNFEVSTINLKEKFITFNNDHQEKFDILINTMPLDIMLTKLVEKTNSNMSQAAKFLECNSVINFNLGINKKNLTEKHWIYFPETKYPFYRIGFPHNFSDSMTPKNYSSISGEMSHINSSKEDIDLKTKASIEFCKNILGFKEKNISLKKIIHIKHAYVIYNFWREKNLDKLLAKLEENNLFSIGRYGAWKYSSMQEAVLDGKNTAENLIAILGKENVKRKNINRTKQPSANL